MIQATITNPPGIVLRSFAASTPAVLRAGLLEAGHHQEAVLRSLIFEVFPRGRTGQLARSYRARFLSKSGQVISVGVLSSLEYASIHDRGGTIAPRTVQYLAVPLRRLPVGKWPRDFAKGELRLIKSRAGNLILAKVSKSGKIAPYFVLKKTVSIRGRNYLRAAADRAAPMLDAIMQRHVDEAAKGAG